MKKHYLFLVVALLALQVNAQTTLSQWTFNNTLAATVVTNVTASNAVLANNTAIVGAYNGNTVYYGEGSWPAGSLATNAYIEFGITPASGYVLNLTTIEMEIRRSTTGSGGGPNNFTLRSSLDNYTSDVASNTLNTSATPAKVVTLGSAFSTINAAVTFRLYGYNSTITTNALARFVFENINIKGSIYNSNAIYFKSKNDGDFTMAANWQYSATGTAYIDATQAPAATNITYIKSGNTLVLPADISIASGKNLTVDGTLDLSGYKITGAGNIMVNGEIKINSAGGLDAVIKNTGTITFADDASYVFKAATTTPFRASSVNVTAKNITVEANVTLNKPVKITGTVAVQSLTTLSTNNNLTLASNSTGTARIDALPAGASINGNVTMQRYVPSGRRAYRMVSHPLNTTLALSSLTDNIDVTGLGGSANGFTTTTYNSPSAYWYNPLTGNGNTVADPGWTAFTAANTNDINNVNSWKRYQAIYVFYRGAKGEGLTTTTGYTPSANTLDVIGAVNTGDQNIPLIKGAGSGYNVIGNPYPSQVDIIPALATTANINGESFWVWDANQGTKGGYSAYKFTGTGALGSYTLPSSGVFVADVTANTTLNFTEANKVSNAAPSLFKQTSPAAMGIELSLQTDEIFWDRVQLFFTKKGTAAKDKGDADKFNNNEVNFYSFSADKKRLSIDERNVALDEKMALGLQSNTARSFQLIVKNVKPFPNTELWLIDNYLKTRTKLEAGLVYDFATNADAASQGDRRFELVQKEVSLLSNIGIVKRNTATLSVSPNPATDKAIVTYKANALSETIFVTVVNASGQVVKSFKSTNQNEMVTIDVKELAKGLYYVQMIIGKEKITEKLQVQ